MMVSKTTIKTGSNKRLPIPEVAHYDPKEREFTTRKPFQFLWKTTNGTSKVINLSVQGNLATYCSPRTYMEDINDYISVEVALWVDRYRQGLVIWTPLKFTTPKELGINLPEIEKDWPRSEKGEPIPLGWAPLEQVIQLVEEIEKISTPINRDNQCKLLGISS